MNASRGRWRGVGESHSLVTEPCVTMWSRVHISPHLTALQWHPIACMSFAPLLFIALDHPTLAMVGFFQTFNSFSRWCSSYCPFTRPIIGHSDFILGIPFVEMTTMISAFSHLQEIVNSIQNLVFSFIAFITSHLYFNLLKVLYVCMWIGIPTFVFYPSPLIHTDINDWKINKWGRKGKYFLQNFKW